MAKSVTTFVSIDEKKPELLDFGKKDKFKRSDLLMLRDEHAGDWAGYLYEWIVDGVGGIPAKSGDLFAISKTNIPLTKVTHWMDYQPMVYPGKKGKK